jgi:amino acid adenylation domain-containing protein/non-ribosomal peptide synthase protein (TIGR01720 family)
MSEQHHNLQKVSFSEEEEELLSLLLEEEGFSSSFQPITPVSRANDLLASFSQQRLWFLNQLQPGSPAYNIPLTLQFSGDLDRTLLERCLSELFQRHESLRTTFRMQDGQVLQVIGSAEDGMLPLPLQDLTTLPVEERQGAAQRLLEAESLYTFDLAHGPLLRPLLLRLSPYEHILQLTAHHIILDGWSLDVLLRELSSLYTAFAQGLSSSLPNLPIQYVDFAQWQRQWLEGERLQAQVDYWEQQLASLPPLELPTDHPRLSEQAFHGAWAFFELPPTLTQTLKIVSQQEEMTIFMALLATFQMLLSRSSGQKDIAVGIPVAGRIRAEVEHVVGCFVNTLVVRTDLSGNPSFREILRRVHKVAQEAYAHQDVPFEKVVEVLQPQRDLSRSPLFQILFNQQPIAPPIKILDTLTLSLLFPESTSAKYDLTLWITETEPDVKGIVEYNTDLFEASTIQRMITHWLTLLENVASNPERRLTQVELLTRQERDLLLVEWNATAVDYPTTTVHQLFEGQAERTPDRVALVFAEEQLTYGELNRRANQLAHHLRGLGVGPEVLVGICLERSLELIIGLLAIFKAGGAYVPLDPSTPTERLAYMLEDARVRLLLTQSQWRGRLPPVQPERLLYMDEIGEQVQQQESSTPQSQPPHPEQLAYVIYTSGSTGQPKAAMNSQQGLLNRLLWMQQAYSLDQNDVVLQKTPISFDVSVWELLWSLIVGAGMVLARPGGHRESDYLHNLIEQQDISVVHFVPSMLQAFLAGEQRSYWAGLRHLICSGEALSLELQQQAVRQLPAQVHNLYGPTEAAIDVTAWSCREEPERRSVPIGRPIANIQIYVLDERLQPVPIGVTGELYIGGVGVARGYLGRPDLTAERFVPDPFSQRPGTRLYRTGDLAAYREDGAIEYVGRTDQQVKLRGYRIELGEIEAALREAPQVAEAVVLLREDQSAEKRLVAYLVAQAGQTLSIAQLSERLQQRLPEYMLPGVFVRMEQLPLTPNGKLDRRALPLPERSRAEWLTPFRGPRTAVERTLATIWQEVLGLDRVGIDDNFFTNGGDSILAILVVSRALKAGLHLTLRHLFLHQTIARLAATVAVVTEDVNAMSKPVEGSVALTPIQRWFFQKEFSSPHHWNQALLLEVPPLLHPPLLEQALGFLVRHHDALGMGFLLIDGIWQQRAPLKEKESTDLLWQVDLNLLAADVQEETFAAMLTQAQQSLHLTQGPLLRAVLFHRGPQQPARLLLVIHHLVVDTVSWITLLQDLQTCYKQIEAGQQVHLPPKTASFQAWAYQIKRYAQTASVRQELDYWLRLGHIPYVPPPIDHPKGANTEAELSSVHCSLDMVQTQALLHEALVRSRTEINHVLLTSLAFAYADWSNQRLLLVDVEGHGRETLFEHVDISRTVGWFTTLVPVLLDVRTTYQLGDGLKQVKEQLRAIPQHGIGYGLLRYLCEDEQVLRQMEALPQAEVVFNYLGQLDRQWQEGEAFKLLPQTSQTLGALHGAANQRCYEVEIISYVAAGRLQVEWHYSSTRYEQQTMEQLAQAFRQRLIAVINYCQTADEPAFTPSDFPAVALTQAELDILLASE